MDQSSFLSRQRGHKISISFAIQPKLYQVPIRPKEICTKVCAKISHRKSIYHDFESYFRHEKASFLIARQWFAAASSWTNVSTFHSSLLIRTEVNPQKMQVASTAQRKSAGIPEGKTESNVFELSYEGLLLNFLPSLQAFFFFAITFYHPRDLFQRAFCYSKWLRFQTIVEVLRTFARNFSNIDFFLQILPLKDDELVMSEM